MKKSNLIIYVHGWNSHAKARKAELLISVLKDNSDYEVLSITLKSHPREAIEQLSQIIDKELQERSVHLIGSSLGGYFSCYLAEKHNIKAAMINPAVWAYKIFENDRGENINPNTNETYFIDQEWVDSLEDIFIQKPDPAKYLVLLQTGDETLDYRYGAKYFEGANIKIDEGGSHSFDNLESKIPIILKHFS